MMYELAVFDFDGVFYTCSPALERFGKLLAPLLSTYAVQLLPRPKANLADLLGKLDCKKVLLTAAPKSWAAAAERYFGIAFDLKYTAASKTRSRYADILRHFSIEPAKAVAIDNSLESLRAAKAAGLATGLIGRARARYIDFSADSLPELLAKIFKI